jgi:hypothetical protein
MPFVGNSGQVNILHEKNESLPGTSVRIVSGEVGSIISADGELNLALPLSVVTNTGNTTSDIVSFTHPTTGIITNSNVIVGGIVKASKFVGDGWDISNVNIDNTKTLNLTHPTTGLNVTNDVIIGGEIRGRMSESVTSGTYMTGGVYDGSSSKTFNVDATTTATSNKVVVRDGSGRIFATSFHGGGTVDPTQTLNLTNEDIGLNVTNNVVVGGEVVAQYFVGDGSQLTGINSTGSSFDTTQTLALSNVTTGLSVSSNAVVTGNVTASIFLGDGGLLSNIESQRVYVLTTNGSSDYIFQGPGFDTPTNDPVLRLIRGFTYIFDNRSNYTIHPFKIRNNYNGSDFTRGVINDGAGMTTFTVPMDAPSSLYYQCSVHSSMGNIIHILSEDIDTTQTLALSNVTTGLSVTSNAVVTGNVTANYFVGDGSNLTGISGGSSFDTTQTLTLSNVTTGLSVTSNALVTGNVTANYFVGDGSNLTGVAATVNSTDDVPEGSSNLYYTDARVNDHLNISGASGGQVLTWNGSDYAWTVNGSGGLDTSQTLGLTNVTTGLSVTSNALITGNVTANYFMGDGSNLTGISGGSSFDTTQTLTLSNVTTGLSVTSNALVTGNVTANYFIGDGSNLTGVSATVNSTDDVPEGSSNLYYTDARVNDHLNISGASGGQVLTWNGSDYAWTVNGSGGLDTTQTLALSNVTTGLSVTSNALVTGNVTANYFMGDGSNLTGIVNTTDTLTLSNVTTGLSVTSNALVTGNVTANYFMGDGSNLTGISGGIDTTRTLALSNVTTGLSVTSNALVTGNVTANYFVGDGSNLTGISGGIDTTQTLTLSNVTTGLSITSNALVQGDLKLLGSMYYNNDVIMNIGSGEWFQMGVDIDGEVVGDESGYSVSLSADGTRVAIGARLNDGKGDTRVYEWSGSVWTQMGLDIDGEAESDQSGYSVSLSADGTRVAIGAPYNDGNGLNSGHTRVYEWSGSVWVQLGLDIDGEAGVTCLVGVSPSLPMVHEWLLGQPLTMVMVPIQVTHVCMNGLGVHGHRWVGI